MLFAFESKAWKESNLVMIELGRVFRQKDGDFVNLLNEMRVGIVSDPSAKTLLGLSRQPRFEERQMTHLYATRAEVDRQNKLALDALPGIEKLYPANDEVLVSPFLENKFDDVMALKVLSLKPGAQVMLIKNLSNRLVNGSLGIVAECTDEFITINFYKSNTTELNPEPTFVGKEVWDFRNAQKKEIARRTQYPLILSYAMYD